MKIRIKGDSIRFRLTRTEVETLCSQGYLKEETHLTPNTFTYAVVKSREPGMKAHFEENTITLQVNEKLVEHWDENDTVGFQQEDRGNDKSRVQLLLEKDFVCLDQRQEDQSDNYPNPKLQQKEDTV